MMDNDNDHSLTPIYKVSDPQTEIIRALHIEEEHQEQQNSNFYQLAYVSRTNNKIFTPHEKTS
jgi:hypothetical protein